MYLPESAGLLAYGAGWNYMVRFYRPRKEILDGAWKFPEAQPAKVNPLFDDRPLLTVAT